jgi:hypothetical protein
MRVIFACVSVGFGSFQQAGGLDEENLRQAKSAGRLACALKVLEEVTSSLGSSGCWGPESTEWLLLARDMTTVSVIEVSMKRIADQVVSLVSRLAAPRGPKAVCEPCPPKAPARSADLPCCRRTTPMRKRQITTWKITSRMIMKKCCLWAASGKDGGWVRSSAHWTKAECITGD